ncbi:oligosaccharide flippase family protein [Streptococcus suis]|uniref:oligosaccharide flippase family protein n=1 Tax=Streptococcus suis TaxID=1307 RepID=UPI001CF4063B|nr:oligosaccharide flippase family protein [Streptococcus suis]MCB2887874.1 oligosaccharide flippase family protein [Streptococcus suis]
MKNRSLKINALLNVVRQGMTILFPFFTFPYISRILGSTEFGKYNFSNSIVSYFALLAAFGMANFAVREGARIREDRQKFSAFASELFIFNIITTVVSIVLLIIATLSSSKLSSYTVLIFIQSVSILLTTIGLDWVNTVYEDYLYITIRYIVLQIIALILIFLLVKSSSDTVIYCLILLLGSYGGNLVNLVYIRRYVDIKLNWKIQYKKILFPLTILFINSLAVTVYVNSDITILGLFTSDHNVGIYSFSTKVYNILKHLINAAIVVTIPRLTAIYGRNKEDYKNQLSEIFNILIIFLIPISVGMVMMSDSIILLIGGEEYLTGESSLRLLSISLIFALLSSVYVNGMLIISRQEKLTLLGTILSAVINVVGNFLLIPKIGMVAAAITTVLAEGINFIIQRYFSKKYVLNTYFFEKTSIICAILGGITTFLVCYYVNGIFLGTTITIVAIRIMLAILLSSFVYLIILILLKYERLMRYIK